MLIAMAGLPGSGKSTLAVRLAQELDGVVLSKDQVRDGHLRELLAPDTVGGWLRRSTANREGH